MKPARHLEWIDFLRGVSAVAVVLYHVRVNLWVGWIAIHGAPGAYSAFDRATAWLSIPAPFFGSAVMLFFLVSGFCVHYPYAGSARPLELKAYSARRLLRIYPPYLAAVAFGVAVELLISHRFGGQSSPVATVLRSAFMVQNYGPQASQMDSNPSLWSLPVEVELYIAYPLFYWLFVRVGGRQALGAVAGVSLAALGLSLSNRLAPGLNIDNHFAVYWIIWCAGALLAEGVKRDRLPIWKPWMGGAMAAALLTAVALSARKSPAAVQHLAWAGFYFLLLFWGVRHPDPMRRFSPAARRMFARLGLISYSLYLIHFPFFKLCGAFWQWEFGAKPANFLVTLAFGVLALPLAQLFYRCVEAPSHRLAREVGRQKDIQHEKKPLLSAGEHAPEEAVSVS